MKKRPESTQTLRAVCSKADPQTNTQTDRGDYNYTAQLSAQCKYIPIMYKSKNLERKYSYVFPSALV